MWLEPIPLVIGDQKWRGPTLRNLSRSPVEIPSLYRALMLLLIAIYSSNLQGKLRKSSSYREFELSRVKLYRKLSEGKWKLLRDEVRIIEGSRYRKSTVCIFIPSQELEYTLQSSKLPPYVINHFSWFGIIEYSHLGFFNVCLQKKNFADSHNDIYPRSYSAPLFCTLALATLTNIF